MEHKFGLHAWVRWRFKELIENPIFNSSKWSISLNCMLGFVGDTLFNQKRMGYEIPEIFFLGNITV